MKKNILMLSALFLSITAMAQTDVTTGVMRGKDYGVTYMLPKTEIEIVLQPPSIPTLPENFADMPTAICVSTTCLPNPRSSGHWIR